MAKFRIKVKSVSGDWIEYHEREIGEARPVRGYPRQPEYEGDPEAWGRALVDWFNLSRKEHEAERVFVGVV